MTCSLKNRKHNTTPSCAPSLWAHQLTILSYKVSYTSRSTLTENYKLTEPPGWYPCFCCILLYFSKLFLPRIITSSSYQQVYLSSWQSLAQNSKPCGITAKWKQKNSQSSSPCHLHELRCKHLKFYSDFPVFRSEHSSSHKVHNVSLWASKEKCMVGFKTSHPLFNYKQD